MRFAVAQSVSARNIIVAASPTKEKNIRVYNEGKYVFAFFFRISVSDANLVLELHLCCRDFSHG